MKTKFFMPKTIAMAIFCLALTGFVRAENQSSTGQQQDQSQGASSGAQQQEPAGAQGQSSTSQSSTSSGASGERIGSSEKVSSEMPKDVNKASKLIGMEVKNQQGERLGKVKDMAVDLDSGRVAYIVVRKSGGLGSEKTIAVPIQAFSKPQGNEQNLVLNIDKQKFDSAKTISENEWPSMQIPQEEVAFWQIETFEPAGAQNKQGEQGQKGQEQQQQSSPDQQGQPQAQPQSSPDQTQPQSSPDQSQQSQPKPQIK